MNKLEFDKEVGMARANEQENVLLGFFVSSVKYSITETITELESIEKGEKTFEEIMDGYADWTFGNNEGEFTCDKEKAYFEGIGEMKYPNIEMPLKELIEILHEWKSFLGK